MDTILDLSLWHKNKELLHAYLNLINQDII